LANTGLLQDVRAVCRKNFKANGASAEQRSQRVRGFERSEQAYDPGTAVLRTRIVQGGAC